MKGRALGFSLIELAVVLCIVGILAGGLLLPLSAQVEQKRMRDTQRGLEEIRDALLGYALINGNLPCPTSVSDPADANYGLAASQCSNAPSAEGYLPWKTLGISETDAWGIKRHATGDAWLGYWRYRVDRNFAGATIALGTNFSADALTLRDNSGTTLTATTERPIAIVYSTGKNLTPDGHNASFEASGGIYQSDAPSPGFDDQTIWLSRPQLYSRLVAAGRLP